MSKKESQIKVQAIETGYLGYYRNIGDVFLISSEKEFSKRWMKKVEAKGKGGAYIDAEEPAHQESESGSDVI